MTQLSRLPALAALLALLIVVAVASAGHRAVGGSGGGPSRTFVDSALSAFLILMALVPVLVVIAWWLDRDALVLPNRKRSQRRMYAALAILLAAAAAAVTIGPHLHLHLRNPFHHGGKPAQPAAGAPQVRTPNGPAAQVQPRFRWEAAAAVLVLVLGAGAALVLVSRPRGLTGDIEDELAPETLAEALDQSLDDLRAEPDPRRAIVAAYARMERSLAAAGAPRRPAEAPLEYLERILAQLVPSAAARRLTDLFRRAKFSDRDLGERGKDEAIDALETLRDELRLETLA
ncbi:MAG: DUF4129 domain-containing protein [Gaiellaceae bacterium]